jgi:hypothetical protein
MANDYMTLANSAASSATAEAAKKLKDQQAAAQSQLNNLQAPTSPYAGGGQFMPATGYLDYMNQNNVYQSQLSNLQGQAGVTSPDQTRRASDYQYGAQQGTNLFYNDPNMQALQDQRIDLSKGYSGGELGAMQSNTIQNMQGQRSQYLQQMQGKLARQGVGGARAAAMQGATDVGMQEKGNEAQRNMLLDSAKMKRQGVNDLQDFLMKQKYGVQASALGQEQLGSSDYAAQQQRNAANGGSSGPCCFIFLEARYGNGIMDKVVRRFRDENMTIRNKRGYYKLTEVIVPLMRKSKLIKLAVRLMMTDPLVSYGKYYYGEGNIGVIFTPVKNFWLKIFDYLGQDHEYIRENGEVI